MANNKERLKYFKKAAGSRGQQLASKFAKLLGKPSSEWTAKDIRRYIKWLWKGAPDTPMRKRKG